MPDATISMAEIFPFRPWVRRAGLSIVLVAGGVTAWMIGAMLLSSGLRYGWLSEPFPWIYVGTLWAGGLKIWLGTRRSAAELSPSLLVLRPLHSFLTKRVDWSRIRGTEQMLP